MRVFFELKFKYGKIILHTQIDFVKNTYIFQLLFLNLLYLHLKNG